MGREIPEGLDPKVGARLRQVRLDLGKTGQQMADAVLVTRGYWSELENGKRVPGPKLLSALERVFMVDPGWVLYGKGHGLVRQTPSAHAQLGKQVDKLANRRISDPPSQAPSSALGRTDDAYVRERQPPPYAATTTSVAALLTLPAAFRIQHSRREYVVIPNIEVGARAGQAAASEGGGLQRKIAATAAGVLAMDRAWMAEQLGRSDSGFATVMIDGDSMSPALRHGDTIIIDTAVDTLAGDGVYVLQYGEALVVKRVTLRHDGSAIVKSDGGGYEPEVLQAATARQLRTVGRMVWPRLR